MEKYVLCCLTASLSVCPPGPESLTTTEHPLVRQRLPRLPPRPCLRSLRCPGRRSEASLTRKRHNSLVVVAGVAAAVGEAAGAASTAAPLSPATPASAVTSRAMPRWATRVVAATAAGENVLAGSGNRTETGVGRRRKAGPFAARRRPFSCLKWASNAAPCKRVLSHAASESACACVSW